MALLKAPPEETQDTDVVMSTRPKAVQRRILLLLLCVFCLSLHGCNKFNPPKKDPVKEEQKRVISNKGRLVGDLAWPSNMTLAKIEGVCLVEGLPDTGADEPPSTYTTMVLQELQRDPELKKTAKHRIASLSTAVALLEVIVPPGARKGDRLDVKVSLPPGSEATSIEGGFVTNARLHEYLATDVIHKGALDGLVSGRVVLDPQTQEREEKIAAKQGKIIGGAVIVRPRDIWLTIKEEERSAGVAQRLEDVINNRFSYKSNGSKKKVAHATGQASRISLVVPDEYRDNINRYVNVICCISFFETPDEMNRRINELRAKLFDPETSELASLQLEAIGPNNPLAVEAIRAGMKSDQEPIRYHSATAMAYMNVREDRADAARILAALARDNALLRPSCMAVLGTALKSCPEVDAALRELLSANSNETRYGAFRALWTRNPSDLMIQGEIMEGRFSYHALNCDGPPMVHIAMSKRPELVLFGKQNLALRGKFEIDAGRRITVRGLGGEVLVKHYKSGIDAERRTDCQLDSIIRAIDAVGGTYAEQVHFLVEAKKQDILCCSVGGNLSPATLAIDALPGANSTAFKRIRDIGELEEMERRLAGDTEKEKTSVWSRLNPKNLFSKKDDADEIDYSQTFRDEPEEEPAEDDPAGSSSSDPVFADKQDSANTPY